MFPRNKRMSLSIITEPHNFYRYYPQDEGYFVSPISLERLKLYLAYIEFVEDD